MRERVLHPLPASAKQNVLLIRSVARDRNKGQAADEPAQQPAHRAEPASEDTRRPQEVTKKPERRKEAPPPRTKDPVPATPKRSSWCSTPSRPSPLKEASPLCPAPEPDQTTNFHQRQHRPSKEASSSGHKSRSKASGLLSVRLRLSPFFHFWFLTCLFSLSPSGSASPVGPAPQFFSMEQSKPRRRATSAHGKETFPKGGFHHPSSPTYHAGVYPRQPEDAKGAKLGGQGLDLVFTFASPSQATGPLERMPPPNQPRAATESPPPKPDFLGQGQSAETAASLPPNPVSHPPGKGTESNPPTGNTAPPQPVDQGKKETGEPKGNSSPPLHCKFLRPATNFQPLPSPIHPPLQLPSP